MDKLAHNEFIEKVYKNNKYYREGVFEIISYYIGAKSKVLTKNKYGICEIRVDSLYLGCNPSIMNAIDKGEYFYNLLKIKNPLVFQKINRVIKYTAEKDKTIVDTIYGDINVYPRSLIEALDIPISSAIDKTNFWIKRNEYSRKDFKDIDYSECDYIDNKHKVHLTCKIHNYHYTQTPSKHAAGIQGCVHCAPKIIMYTKENIEMHRNFFENIHGVLYIIKLKNNNESFYKVGITSKNRFDYRMSDLGKNYKVSVRYTEEMDMVSAFEIEQKFLDEFKKYKYLPKIKFSGYTECLSINPIYAYYDWCNSTINN